MIFEPVPLQQLARGVEEEIESSLLRLEDFLGVAEICFQRRSAMLQPCHSLCPALLLCRELIALSLELGSLPSKHVGYSQGMTGLQVIRIRDLIDLPQLL